MLEKLFGGKKKFKGQGHRLGSDDKESNQAAAQQASKPASRSKASSRAAPVAVHQSTGDPPTFQGRAHKLGHAAENERSKPATNVRKPAEPDRPELSAEAASSSAVHVEFETAELREAADPSFQLLDPESAQLVASEELQTAFLQLEQGPEDPKDVLKRLFANILSQPLETKYRRIRLGNPKIQAAIVDADGGLEMLQACGFQVVMDDAEDGATGDAFAVLPEDDDLLQMNAALSLMGFSHPPPASLAATGNSPELSKPTEIPWPSTTPKASNLSQPCDRETQVLVPAGPEGAEQVQPWVFQRTPAELKAAMQEARRKQEQSEMLMTKATREKLQGGKKVACTSATVRVRLPEGLLLQGRFNADEPVAAVFDWVTDSLAEPGMTYELVLPSRKPLVTAMGTLRSADLLPNVVLILRSDARDSSAEQQLTVRQDLLMDAK